MADIQINELLEAQTAADSDWIAIDNGSATKKISVLNFNATGAASAAQSAASAAQSATDATTAKNAAIQAKDDAQALITSAQTIVSNAQTYAGEAATSANTASTAANTATAQAAIATQAANTAAGYAQNVDNFAKTAKSWAVGGTGTRSGEDTDNSKYYSQQAHDSEINAAASESNASTSETNAAASESTASSAASSASTNALKAEGYAVGTQNGTPAASGETYYHDNAKYYKEQAATSETNAASSETNAGLSEAAAAASESAAKGSEEDSEAWAWGKIDGVDVPPSHPAYHNNAKYYADQASGGVSGVSSFNARTGNVTPQLGDYAANIVEFDNSNNGFVSTNTQAAIEEVQNNVDTLDGSLATVAKSGAYGDLSGTPSLGTAAAKDVPASGDASSAQVVLGSDTRLTDARTPVSHTHTKSEITDFPVLGTAAAKDSTNAVTSGSTDLVESGAVHSAIETVNSALADCYSKNDSTETAIDDADYIPFYDTSAQAMKKISKADANFGGGGAGSLFVIRTDETELYGQTVNITDGVLVWQGQFNNSGVAEVLGVTAIGALTITATDGTETAETIYTVKNYSRYDIKLNFYTVYGFRVDATKSTANVSYKVMYNGDKVENYDYTPGYMNFTTDTWIWGSWTGEEFFMPRPVLIKQDYSEKIYLNPDNLSLDEDGNDVSSELTGTTDGYNAMMEWGRNGKKIWYKLVPESDDATYTCYIADKQLDNDFHAWSFYDANNVLGDHFYTSIYNGSTVSNVLRSLSGKTPNNTTAGATQITQAKANNKNSESYAWYIDVFADRILINLLMILVIQSTNSDAIGYGNYTGGSSASNLLTTGQGNTKGMFYGKQSNSVCKVFGMENWFANCWRRMAGLILNGGAQLYKLTYGTADGSSAAGYIENDNAPSNYLNAGKNIATNLSSSYIVKESALSNGALVASTFGGSNGTYYSDAYWSSTGVKYARVGGACHNGSTCGAFALYLYGALSGSDWAVGCALSLKPLAQ